MPLHKIIPIISVIGVFASTTLQSFAGAGASRMPVGEDQFQAAMNYVPDSVDRKVRVTWQNEDEQHDLRIEGVDLIAEGLEAVVMALSKSTHVKRVFLGNNKFLDEHSKGLRELTLTLQHHPSITVLSLSHNALMGNAAGYISNTFLTQQGQQPYSGHLSALDLSHVGMKSGGFKRLVKGLKNCPTLKELNVSGNPLGKGAGDCAADLIRTLDRDEKDKNLCRLRKLDISECKLGPVGIEQLCCGMWAADAIEELHLRDNVSRMNDVRELGAGISRGLYFFLNDMILMGGGENPRIPMHTKTLKVLDVAGNHLGDKQAIVLIETVWKTCGKEKSDPWQLKKLILDRNGLTHHFVGMMVSKLIRAGFHWEKSSLELVSLRNNPIGESHIDGLVKLVKHAKFKRQPTETDDRLEGARPFSIDMTNTGVSAETWELLERREGTEVLERLPH